MIYNKSVGQSRAFLDKFGFYSVAAKQSQYYWSTHKNRKSDNFAFRIQTIMEYFLQKGILTLLTSVVITSALALGFMVTSPVIRPTSWNSSYNSRYFWLLRAFK